eukprot:2339130-Pyramimonas_sp.AAC.1
MAKDIIERNHDPVVAYASSSNHHVISDCFSGLTQNHGLVTVALGCEPGCSSLEVASALNSYFEPDADITSHNVFDFFR